MASNCHSGTTVNSSANSGNSSANDSANPDNSSRRRGATQHITTSPSSSRRRGFVIFSEEGNLNDKDSPVASDIPIEDEKTYRTMPNGIDANSRLSHSSSLMHQRSTEELELDPSSRSLGLTPPDSGHPVSSSASSARRVRRHYNAFTAQSPTRNQRRDPLDESDRKMRRLSAEVAARLQAVRQEADAQANPALPSRRQPDNMEMDKSG